VHDTFTELSITEAGPRQILDAVVELSGCAVVLEDVRHRIVDYRPGPSRHQSGPDDTDEFLGNWQSRSRAVELTGRTGWDPHHGWLVTRLGRRERGWGRLVLQAPEPPTQRTFAIVERAAAALTVHLLHDHSRSGPIRRAHHELLLALLTDPDQPRLLQRCEVLGLPITGRVFVGATLRPVLPMNIPGGPPASLADDVIAALVRAADDLGVATLVSAVQGEIRALLSLPEAADPKSVLDEVAARVDKRYPIIVGVGRPVTQIQLADHTLKEAQHVTESVRQEPPTGRIVHRIDDVHVRGLLVMLSGDERLRLFVDRELRPLKEHDERYKTDLVPTLRALLRNPGSKSDAAASLNMSRPAFYDRLARISTLLDADLEDPDIRLSLHLALIADELAA
jgi:purine catabolism regulator